MSGRSVFATAVAVAMLGAAPAAAEVPSSSGKTVTATGTGQAKVHPANRHSSASIAAAVDAARHAAITSAVNDAHQYALDYAKATGLTLGDVVSISDVMTNNGFYGPYSSGAFFGPFGPNKYCGTLRRPTRRPAPGIKPTFKKIHRCIVPPFASTTLTVTYAAS